MKEIALPTTDFAENAVVNVSRVFEPKEVKWLWYPYIPFGKVTLLQDDPGDGKSKLMLSIAALLSNGEPLPFTDEEETEPMTIIYQDNIYCKCKAVRKCQKALEYGVSGYMQTRGFGRFLYGQIV